MKPVEKLRLAVSRPLHRAARCAGKEGLFVGSEAAFGGAQKERVVIGRGGEEVDDARERVDAVQRGAGAFKHLDGVHGFEGDGEIEVVVRGLAVVDAEAVEQDQGLLKAAAAKDEVGLARRLRRAASRKMEESWRRKSSGVSAASFLPSSGRTSTERGDSASGTGAAEPRTTMVSVRAGMAGGCGVDALCANAQIAGQSGEEKICSQKSEFG